eukprot:7336692-Pyramimonas_sp.AAC.1
MAPKSAQAAPRGPKMASWPQEAPKRPTGGPRETPKRPRETPRGTQDAPRGLGENTKSTILQTL